MLHELTLVFHAQTDHIKLTALVVFTKIDPQCLVGNKDLPVTVGHVHVRNLALRKGLSFHDSHHDKRLISNDDDLSEWILTQLKPVSDFRAKHAYSADLVSVQCRTHAGSTNRRRKLPRL